MPTESPPASRGAAAASLATRIEQELWQAADPVRAASAKRYLKSELAFIGLRAPQLRAVVRSALREARPDRGQMLALAAALWARPVFELRVAAVEALGFDWRRLAAPDLAAVEDLIRDSHTWALVDALAINVAARLVERFDELGASIDRWAGDGDFWVRRAALLALLPPLRRGGGDFERFGRHADAMLDEREFFIRKAIGWVLREVGKKRPALVETWLAPRLGRAAGLIVREAVKYLPAEARATLLRARPGKPS
jgi:3-methyladenine DNA glycosylase AlkD